MISVRGLDCVEVRQRLEGGTTLPIQVGARVARGEPVEQFVLKVREPSQGVHHGPSSLAAEMVVALLGQTIGIQVPEPVVLRVPRGLALTARDRALAAELERNVGECFGSRLVELASPWSRLDVATTDEQRDALEDLLAFDAAILNGDRKNKNLIWSPSGFHAIDHALALPFVGQQNAHWPGDVIWPKEQTEQHIAFPSLQRRNRKFVALFERWRHWVTPGLLKAIRSVVPAVWQSRAGDLDRIFEFLATRTHGLAEVSKSLREVVR